MFENSYFLLKNLSNHVRFSTFLLWVQISNIKYSLDYPFFLRNTRFIFKFISEFNKFRWLFVYQFWIILKNCTIWCKFAIEVLEIIFNFITLISVWSQFFLFTIYWKTRFNFLASSYYASNFHRFIFWWIFNHNWKHCCEWEKFFLISFSSWLSFTKLPTFETRV